MTISSCSSNEIEPMSASDLALAKYEKAFIARFGQPAKDQTWGFGTVATKSLGLSTRAIASSYRFPDDASSDKFLDDVPEGVEKYVYGKVVSYIDESFSGQRVEIQGTWVNDHNEPGTLYIKGNVDLTNGYFYVAQNTTIYLVKGATLTLNANDSKNFQNGCNFYIADGAKIVTDGDFIPNSCNFYNHGTIKAANVLPNGNSLIYNHGTIETTGKVTLNNLETKLVNDGELSASELNTWGSSKFQNTGIATISGKTTVNSNDNIWVNNGKYTTATYTYQAGSSEVVNTCSMKVTGEFYINLGDNAGQNSFRMDGGASCVVGSFKAQGPFYIYMGANALFKVEGTATLDATKANYGIYGPTSGYAVFQAKDIVNGRDGQGYEVTYGNNLYIVAETHFAQGKSGDYPYIDFKGGCSENNIYKDGKLPSFSIESSECNPGFTGETPDPTPQANVRVIAEDLSVSDNSDFDFNDVVFDVTFDSPEQGKTTITLQAAGGTLPLYVGGHEVHEEFGVSTKTMVNTVAGASKDPVRFVLDDTFGHNANNILVQVEKEGVLAEITAERGMVASKIAVKPNYEWCKERQDIEAKYPVFGQYVKGKVEGGNWWEIK